MSGLSLDNTSLAHDESGKTGTEVRDSLSCEVVHLQGRLRREDPENESMFLAGQHVKSNLSILVDLSWSYICVHWWLT